MELQYSPAEVAFRDEVRNFINANLPDRTRQGMLLGGALIKEDVIAWQRVLNKQGWAVSHWPVEWGGTGWSPIQQYIFTEELQRAPAPRPLAYSVYMLGPVLIAFGSDEQKRRFLPRIANLDDWWCQSFSEPDAARQQHKGRPLIEDPRFREKLAAIEVELQALEMTQLRLISAESHSNSGKADPASSILKIKGSEIQQATSELLMQTLGPQSMKWSAQAHDVTDWTSTITGNYFNWRKVSIFGGSNEIQKSIIARSILGL